MCTVVDCCGPLAADTLAEGEADATAQLFKALADPARVKIVNRLARSEQPVCACEFIPALGLSQATVSHHLKVLLQAGLVEREQRGNWAYFRVREGPLAAIRDLLA